MTPVGWGAIAVLAIGLVLALAQIQGLRRRFSSIPQGDDEMISILQRLDTEMETLFSNASEVGARVGDLEGAAPRTLLQSGVARYDGFPGMVGNLSRSVSVLDASGNGFVLTVLVNRDDSRFFLKGVEANEGLEPLSPEEKAAVRSAGRG